MGPSSDVWDEALGSKAASGGGTMSPTGAGGGAAEAGKAYEKGRNWTSVVLEVVPGHVRINSSTTEDGEEKEGQVGKEEDEDVLEVPVRVRLEWRQGDLDEGADKKARLNEDGADDGRRELAYWMVLGMGRVKT